MITRVLVTVMTYPTLSKNHFETVCTAGFREDGSWIRIYPVPHRLLFQYDKPKYGKWQWIEADLEKNPRDGRPESFHIKNIESLKILDKIDAGAPNWNLRDYWIKKNKIVFNDMTEVLKQTKMNKISLAVLKPTEFLSISSEEEDLTSYNQRLTALKKKYEAEKIQLSLFDDTKAANETFEFAKKLPVKFRYEFKTGDGKLRKMMIEDWEIGMLYLNCYWNSKKLTEEEKRNEAIQKVKEKYWEFASKRDTYLLIGTQYKWQNRNSPDPYVIIGVFSEPKHRELSLFEDY